MKPLTKTFSITFKIILILIIPLISISLINGKGNRPADPVDIFGVKEFYPTKKGTTDWFLKCPCNPVSPTEKFSWGGKNVTWRIDEVDSVEFQRLSIREIDPKGKF